MGKRNRKHGIIDGLDPYLKDAVEQMLLTGSTYSEIVQYLKDNQVSISMSSVCRYAQAYTANVEMLNMAQENFRMMMEEMNKYPDLDTTEAIIRLTSQNVFNKLAKADEKEWDDISLDKMLKETNGLIRAAAYKKRIDIQNKEEFEVGLESIQSLAFEAMAKEQPELYKQVTAFLNSKKAEMKQ